MVRKMLCFGPSDRNCERVFKNSAGNWELFSCCPFYFSLRMLLTVTVASTPPAMPPAASDNRGDT
jgi:hypothetical protein